MNRLIISIISFAIVTILCIFVIWPQYQDLKPKQIEIENKMSELQKQQEFYDELVQNLEELKKYPEALAKIDSALPVEVSMPSMLEYLQKKASEAGMILKSFGEASVSSSKENPRIKEYRMNISVSGSYSAIKDFLKIFENSARIIEIENITFSSVSQDDTPMSFSLNLKFYSY
ncbi:type 4a pilus biogenesis protein PilO [Patescibacteria group bacterium]